jgi:hypothetical protein
LPTRSPYNPTTNLPRGAFASFYTTSQYYFTRKHTRKHAKTHNNKQPQTQQPTITNCTMSLPTTPPIPTVSHHFVDASAKVFGRTPYEWQLQVGSHILHTCSSKETGPSLLVRPTGGGKSLVRDAVATVLGGVSLTIVPLLSLASAQCRKLNDIACQEHCPVLAYNLDELKTPQAQRRIVQRILSSEATTNKRILLFSSPQSIVKSDIFKTMLQSLLLRKLLRLIAVDEMHLFVHFGLSFRKEFRDLDEHLFALVRTSMPNRTTVPILFMTATCSKRIQADMESMTQLKIPSSTIFWPNATGMKHRSVKFTVDYSNGPTQVIHKRLVCRGYVSNGFICRTVKGGWNLLVYKSEWSLRVRKCLRLSSHSLGKIWL